MYVLVCAKGSIVQFKLLKVLTSLNAPHAHFETEEMHQYAYNMLVLLNHFSLLFFLVIKSNQESLYYELLLQI